MGDQIYIGNFAKGLTRNRLPFNIDNDAFPYVYNFYLWRGRAKKKRGTVLLGQLRRQIKCVQSPSLPWEKAYIMQLNGSGAGSANIISVLSLESTSAIEPGSLSLTDGVNTYTDSNGVITGAPAGSGTINYATGAITITGGAANGYLIGTFSYFPQIPVMGLEDFLVPTSSGQLSSPYPVLLSFDTVYSYQFSQTANKFYNVSYYKSTNNPVVWTGQNYQQFWSENYSGAFWATNNVPGMQFETISTITKANPTVITTGADHGLITGDYVWFNEITGADAGTLNGKAFSITKTGNTTFTVAIDTTTLTINNSGIFQTLTKTPSTSSGNGIKWYDGDPTNQTGIPTTTATGWVNFAPPLTSTTVSINNLPAALYYLVGALQIVTFKDRLLFFSPWIQTSGGTPIQLEDTVIWSWNGTPYYNALVPSGQTYDVTSYYVDETGKGGWLSAGIDQPISTVTSNEDVLIVGFSSRQTRFVYTANDFNPFLFFNINSELGSSSTFSGINLDRGAITVGSYGIVLTTQQSAQRIDLEIPDEVFEIQGNNHGAERVSAARDFFKEWIYFSYSPTNSQWVFPTQTFLYNYRDNTWAIHYENFTAHGTFRRTSSYTWATLPFSTWDTWTESWDSGNQSAQFPNVVGGNPQGYVLIKSLGTGEALSGSITAMASGAGGTQITSTNHCVRVGDYLYISGCLGITALNNQIGMVISTADANTFVIDLAWPGGTYTGNGKYARMTQPLIQTKQFNFYWDQGRQVRLGVQKYLLDRTENGQITLQIYLSQDPDNAWNSGSIVPTTLPEPINNSLIYSQVLFTSPETDNLQTPTSSSQFQIWHRVNTSLQGESVQIGFTLNDAQMRNLQLATSEISIHGMQLSVYPGPLLS